MTYRGANTGSTGPQGGNSGPAGMYRRARLIVLQVNFRFYP